MTSQKLMAFFNGEVTSDRDLLELLVHYPGILYDLKLEDICRILGNSDKLAEMLNGENVPNLGDVKGRLLQKLKRGQHIHAWGNSDFYRAFLDDLERIPLLREGFKGKRVVELGPERRPVYALLSRLGITGYTAVEPNYADKTREALKSHEGQIEVVPVDGLSYLLTQPNDSCVVVSFGVLPYCSEPYNELIAKEIFRATVPDGVSVHYPKARDFYRYPYVKAGFRPIEVIVKGLDTSCDIFVKPSHN